MPRADMTPDDDRPNLGPDGEANEADPLTDPDWVADDALAAPAEITVDEIATLLAAAGRGLHAALGDPRIDEHWAFTTTEIDSLAPPLTAIVNRRPALLAVVRQSDAATAALVLAAYLRRNLKLSAEIADAEAEAADQADVDRVPIVPDDGDRPRDFGAGSD